MPIDFMRIVPVFMFLFLAPVFVFAQQAPPPGVDIVLGTCTTTNCISVLDAANSIGYFLYVTGGILAGITIVGTGIMYLLSHGDSQKITGAKNMFKAGLIGALILFSPGVIISTITGFSSNPLGFFSGGGGATSTSNTPTPTSGGDITYGCNSSNACVQVAGGIFADLTCAGQCGGATGQSTSGACFDCTNQGGVWCLATASCISNELSCPGIFTREAGGCP